MHTRRNIKEVEPNSFIYEINRALPGDICQEMIRRFDKYKNEQYAGRIGQTAEEHNDIKRSTDLVISGKEHRSEERRVGKECRSRWSPYH